jgi:hypothetical protein
MSWTNDSKATSAWRRLTFLLQESLSFLLLEDGIGKIIIDSGEEKFTSIYTNDNK